MASVKQLFTCVKQAVKTAVCCLLCIVVIAFSSYKTPVKAAIVGPAIAPAIGVAVAAGLACLGVAISGTMPDSDYAKLINKMQSDSVKSAFNGVTATAMAGVATYHLTKNFLQALGDQFMTFYNYMQGTTAVTRQFGSNASASGVNINNHELWSRLGFSEPVWDDLYTSNITAYAVTDIVTRTLASDGTYVTSHFLAYGMDSYCRNTTLYQNGQADPYTFWGYSACSDSVFGYLVDYSYKIGSTTYTDSVILFNNPASISSKRGKQLEHVTGSNVVPIDDGVINTANKAFADGVSILNNSVPDVINKVGDKVGEKDTDGKVTSIPVSVPVGADVGNPSKLRDSTATQSKVTDVDIADESDTDADKTTNKDKDTTPPKSSTFPDLSIPSEVFQKFPFCLPWDLYASLVTLQATAAPPKFKVPFLHKTDWGLNLDIVLDMSQFESIAVVCRWGFSIMWIIGLIFLTRKLIWK